MALTYRLITGSALSHRQLDDNFNQVIYSASLTSSDGTFTDTIKFYQGQTTSSGSNSFYHSDFTMEVNAVTASYALYAVSASHEIITETFSTTATSASHAVIADSSLSALTATSATSASHSERADFSDTANSATTATSATSASHSERADFSDTANSATTATTASYITDTFISASAVRSLFGSGGGTDDRVDGLLLESGSVKTRLNTIEAATSSYLTAEADTLATVTGRGAATSTALDLNGGINVEGVNIDGAGAKGYLYVAGNAATTDPTNVQGIALAYNDDGGNRASMLYYNPGAVSPASNSVYYFGIENEYLNSENSNARTSSLNLKMYGNGMIDLVGDYPTIGNSKWRLPVTSGSSGQVLKYPSSGILLEWADDTGGGGSSFTFGDLSGSGLISGSDQLGDLGYLPTSSLNDFLTGSGFLLTSSLGDRIGDLGLGLISGSGYLLTSSLGDKIGELGLGLLSGSDQLDRLGFLDRTASRLDLDDYLTGSLGEIIKNSTLTLVSGSGQLPDLITRLGLGVLSGSGQIGALGYLSSSAGFISASGQIGALGYLNNSNGFISSSGQITYGDISAIPGGLVSGSGQISFGDILGKPGGLFSGSFGDLGGKPVGLFSGSFGDLAPTGLLSGSGQVSYGGIGGKPANLISGSGQVSALGFLSGLSTGILSGSGQIDELGFLNRTASRLDINDYLTGSLAGIIGNST